MRCTMHLGWNKNRNLCVEIAKRRQTIYLYATVLELEATGNTGGRLVKRKIQRVSGEDAPDFRYEVLSNPADKK